MVSVEQRHREWVVRHDDVVVSVHPTRSEAARAAVWLAAHHSKPASRRTATARPVA